MSKFSVEFYLTEICRRRMGQLLQDFNRKLFYWAKKKELVYFLQLSISPSVIVNDGKHPFLCIKKCRKIPTLQNREKVFRYVMNAAKSPPPFPSHCHYWRREQGFLIHASPREGVGDIPNRSQGSWYFYAYVVQQKYIILSNEGDGSEYFWTGNTI